MKAAFKKMAEAWCRTPLLVRIGVLLIIAVLVAVPAWVGGWDLVFGRLVGLAASGS